MMSNEERCALTDPNRETSKRARPPRRRSGAPRRPKRAKEAPAKRPTPSLSESDDEQDDEAPAALGSAIRESRVRWLLPGLLPLGSTALLEGRKAVGKSAVACAIAAAVAGGPALPGGRRRPAQPVVWLAGEEHVPSCTRPKYAAAGGNLDFIYFPGWDTRGLLSRPWLFPADFGRLERLLVSCGAGLVVLDPLSSFAAPGLCLRDEQDARRLMDPFNQIAGSTGALVLLLRHVKKGNVGHAQDQGLGSIAITNAARSVLRVDQLDDPAGRRVLRVIACNAGAAGRPLAFDLGDAGGHPAVLWRGSLDPDDPRLSDEGDDPAERDAFADAQRFLLDALREGKVAARDLNRKAEEVGITRSTLRRAKKHLGVKSFPTGNLADRTWWWRLPPS